MLSHNNCRSGCKTKDHSSYAECARAANPTINATATSSLAGMWSKTKSDLAAYETARRNGIQPESTSIEKVREAETASKRLGKPYDANTMPPANMIVNKNTARFVNASD
jgi:hypothetical protein